MNPLFMSLFRAICGFAQSADCAAQSADCRLRGQSADCLRNLRIRATAVRSLQIAQFITLRNLRIFLPKCNKSKGIMGFVLEVITSAV